MEAIKNYLRPGHPEDTQTTSSHDNTANTTDATHQRTGLTGEGSHLSGKKEDTNLSTQGNTMATHHTSGFTGEGSHLAGNRDHTNLSGQSGLNPVSNHPSSVNRTTDTRQTEGLTGASNLSGNYQRSGAAQGTNDPSSATRNPNATTHQTQQTEGLGGQGSHFVAATHLPGHQSSSVGNSSSHSGSTTAQHGSDLPTKLDPRFESQQPPHIGSDNTESINSGAGYSSTTGGFNTAHPGPHQTNTANLLDPNLSSSSRTGHTEDAIHHTERHGGGAEEADNDHRDGGKKAAVAGAVGLGAIGMGSASHPSRFTDRGADMSNQHQTMMPGAYPTESDNLAGGDLQPGTRTTQHGSQNVTAIPDRTRTTTEPASSVGQKEHQYDRDNAPISSSTGNAYGNNSQDRTRAANEPTSSVGEKEHHYGRDAALVGGGAAGLGAAAYGINSQDRSRLSNEPTSSSGDREHHYGRDNAPTGSAAGNAYGNNPQDRTRITNEPTSSVGEKEHHYGRDAAIVGGAVGLGGAAYGSNPQDQTRTMNEPTTNTRTMNEPTSSVGSNPQDRTHTTNEPTSSVRDKEHHYGRDAAIVGGAAGLGGAAYGNNRQDHTHTMNEPTSSVGSNPQDRTRTMNEPTTNTRTMNEPTSSVGSNPQDRTHTTNEPISPVDKEHHYGRDAALVGGAAGIGATAYGNNPQDRSHDIMTGDTTSHQTTQHQTTQHQTAPHQTAPHQTTPQQTTPQQTAPHSSALAANYDGQDEREVKRAEKQHEKQVKAAEKDHKHAEEKHEKSDKKEHKGLFSFLHRDKSKKYTKDEEDEFDRQERDHNARNAAGGAAVAGTGTYAAHQHHSSGHKPSTSSSSADHKGHTPLAEKPPGTSLGDKLHGVERYRGVEGSTGFPNGGEPHDGYINHHTGEKVSAGAAAGSGAAHGERRPSIAEKLHLTGRNRGVHGTTGEGGSPNDDVKHHTSEKSIPAGTAAGTGAGALRHEQRSVGDSGTYQHENVHGGTGQSSSTSDYSHTAAGALGSHEKKVSVDDYNSSQNTRSDILSPASDRYTHSTSSHPSQTQDASSQDAAPRHLTSEQKAHHTSGSGALDPNSGVKTEQGVGESHIPGAGMGHGTTHVGDDGRNRLHKDPPARY